MLLRADGASTVSYRDSALRKEISSTGVGKVKKRDERALLCAGSATTVAYQTAHSAKRFVHRC